MFAIAGMLAALKSTEWSISMSCDVVCEN